MRFSFAWSAARTPWSSALDREDEAVFSFEIAHTEGEFPTLSLDVRNPRIGLLNAGRDVWGWLGVDDGSTAGATPLFFGRLVGIPQQLSATLVQLAFIARPEDWDAQRQALAAELKIAPYWDPLWIDAANREDPDSALEARTQLWHIDRTTLVVTASDAFAGEDGTIDFGENFDAATLDVGYSQPPVRRVAVTGTVSWHQVATGSVDFTKHILVAAAAAGSRQGNTILSLTGAGLQGDWPKKGDNIGGGWSVGKSQAPRADGTIIPPGTVEVVDEVGGIVTSIPVWALLPTFFADYDVSRQRTETVSFILEADCQALLTEPGDAEVITLALSSNDADAPIDGASSDDPIGALPIGDARRNSYFKTDRGHQSVQYLISLARAQLLMRARAVEIGFEVPLAAGLALSCRQNARITDPRLPGGTAAGKIIGYTLSADGDTGVLVAQLRLGCMVGQGNVVTESAGTPDYVADGYVEDGYQTRTGEVIMPIAGEVTYGNYDATPNGDDGVNFFDMRANTLVEAVTMFDGLTAQRAALAPGALSSHGDAATVAAVLAAIFTEILVDLKQLDGGPFETDFAIEVSQLMVPKTIDLEAASS